MMLAEATGFASPWLIGLVAAAFVALGLRLTGRTSAGRTLTAVVFVAALLAVFLPPGCRDSGSRRDPLAVILIDLSRSQGRAPGRRLGLSDDELRGEERVVVIGAGTEAHVVYDGPRRRLQRELTIPANLMTPEMRRDADMSRASARVAEVAQGRPLDLLVLTDGGLGASASRRLGSGALILNSLTLRGLTEPAPEDLSLRRVGVAPVFAGGNEELVELLIHGVLSQPRRVTLKSSTGGTMRIALGPGPVAQRLLFPCPAPAPGTAVTLRLVEHRDWDRDADLEEVVLLRPGEEGDLRVGVWDPSGSLAALVGELAAVDPKLRLRRSSRLEEALERAEVLLLYDAAAPTPLGEAEDARIEEFVTRGGGLALSGVQAAFGRGAWDGSRIDQLSPLAARPGTRPRSLTVALDRSGSMAREGRIQSAVAATRELLETLDGRDRARVILFADAIDIGPWRDLSERASAITRLSGVSARGGTDLVGTLDALLAGQADPARQEIVLLLTDGRDPRLDDPARRSALLERARRCGRRFFVFWFDFRAEDEGRASRETFLGELAEACGGRLERLEDFGGLTRAFFEAAAGGLRREKVTITNLKGEPAELAALLRTRTREDADVLASGGPDRAVYARRSAGAGRVLALPVALDRASLDAIFAAPGAAGLAAALRGLASKDRAEAWGTLAREEAAFGERLVFHRRPGVAARPAAIVGWAGPEGDRRIPLSRVGRDRFETAPQVKGLPAAARLVAVEDAAGQRRGPFLLPPRDLHDLARPVGDAARRKLEEGLRAGARPASSDDDGPPYQLLALAALIFALDLLLRARAR